MAKDHEAFVPLEDWYRYDISVRSNFDAALDPHKRAVDQYDALADSKIEDCCLRSIGMERDPDIACCWS